MARSAAGCGCTDPIRLGRQQASSTFQRPTSVFASKEEGGGEGGDDDAVNWTPESSFTSTRMAVNRGCLQCWGNGIGGSTRDMERVGVLQQISPELEHRLPGSCRVLVLVELPLNSKHGKVPVPTMTRELRQPRWHSATHH